MRTIPLTAVLLLGCASLASADTLAVTSVADNTLIEDPDGAWSLGAAYNFYVGRVGVNGGGTIRRGVIRFDVSAIPAGSTIQSVTLKLYCSKTGNTLSSTVSLKRLTNSFGEGASFAFGGAGAESEPGDATWLHRSYPNVFWNTPGGDFVSTVSASRSVTTVGYYTWNSTAQFVADVQSWVNAPATNLGWLVQGNETTLQSVKRFDAHETQGITRPILTVTYVPPVFGDVTGDQKVNAADLSILLGQWGGPGSADLSANGVVDADDLAMLLGAWTP
ncbi:MAG: DNRLRE domain-containing protein [Phycisphaerales bacterium]